jgi:hypothetical protein
LQRELLRRKNLNRSAGYIPNGKAEKFIKMIGKKDHPFVCMFIGANGTSKSATGANVLANIVYGPQNDFFQLPTFQHFPYPIKRARIISDPTTLKEKTIPELKKWFPNTEASKIPQATYETSKEGKPYETKWQTNTGWTIDLMSTEQDPKEFESVDISLVWIDEPMPQDRFMATIGRARLGMVIIWTYTPLFSSGWIKDWMDEAVTNGLADYVEAEMEDNCLEHGIRGILEHENIVRMANSFPAAEREARVFGKFGHLIGRVHKGWNRQIHVRKAIPLNPKDWTTYMALDPHPRVADHVMWMSVNAKGQKIISADLQSEGGAKDLSVRIKDIETKHNFRMGSPRIIDPSAFVEDQHKDKREKTFAEELEKYGLYFAGGAKDLNAGIKRTDDALDYEVVGERMVRSPELIVFDTCITTIKQMESYVWGEWKGAGKDEKKPSGKPRDKDDHMPENLHRLLLLEPEYVHPDMRRPRNRDNDELDPYA